MALSISAGRMVMTDGSGNVRFDTDERLFRPTDHVVSSGTLPSYTATNNGASETVVNTETIYSLQAINSLADTVRGTLKFSASAHGFSTDLVYNASGSIVVNWVAGGFFFGGTWYCGHRAVAAARILTFYCESGYLKLSDRIMVAAENPTCFGTTTSTLTVVGATINWSLFCGTFAT